MYNSHAEIERQITIWAIDAFNERYNHALCATRPCPLKADALRMKFHAFRHGFRDAFGCFTNTDPAFMLARQLADECHECGERLA